jgi:hypothetical protein
MAPLLDNRAFCPTSADGLHSAGACERFGELDSSAARVIKPLSGQIFDGLSLAQRSKSGKREGDMGANVVSRCNTHCGIDTP